MPCIGNLSRDDMNSAVQTRQSNDVGHHLHVKEGSASVWSADAEHSRGAHFLQCQQEHGSAKDGPSAAPEATGIVCALFML